MSIVELEMQQTFNECSKLTYLAIVRCCIETNC